MSKLFKKGDTVKLKSVSDFSDEHELDRWRRKRVEEMSSSINIGNGKMTVIGADMRDDGTQLLHFKEGKSFSSVWFKKI